MGFFGFIGIIVLTLVVVLAKCIFLRS